MAKEYLGDGVYADFDGQQIILTTENGYVATNTIFMEPAVLQALNEYVKRLENTTCPVQSQTATIPSSEPEPMQPKCEKPSSE